MFVYIWCSGTTWSTFKMYHYLTHVYVIKLFNVDSRYLNLLMSPALCLPCCNVSVRNSSSCTNRVVCVWCSGSTPLLDTCLYCKAAQCGQQVPQLTDIPRVLWWLFGLAFLQRYILLATLVQRMDSQESEIHWHVIEVNMFETNVYPSMCIMHWT